MCPSPQRHNLDGAESTGLRCQSRRGATTERRPAPACSQSSHADSPGSHMRCSGVERRDCDCQQHALAAFLHSNDPTRVRRHGAWEIGDGRAIGAVASAAPLHGVGRGFESLIAHHFSPCKASRRIHPYTPRAPPMTTLCRSVLRWSLPDTSARWGSRFESDAILMRRTTPALPTVRSKQHLEIHEGHTTVNDTANLTEAAFDVEASCPSLRVVGVQANRLARPGSGDCRCIRQ